MRTVFWAYKLVVEIGRLCDQQKEKGHDGRTDFARIPLAFVIFGAELRLDNMSSYFKIPKEIPDPVVLFEGNRARVISKAHADRLTSDNDGRIPQATICGTRNIRSNLGKLTLPAVRANVVRQGLSARMTPRHPQSGGDFRRGAYHDLLDSMKYGEPELLRYYRNPSNTRKQNYAAPK
jgi:hypothetical protein